MNIDDLGLVSTGDSPRRLHRDAAELTAKDFVAAERSERSFPPHSHDEDQLFWFPDGGVDLLVGGGRWLLHRDTVAWIPAGIVHSTRLLGPGSTLSIYASPTLRPAGDRWARPLALTLDPLVGAIMAHLPNRAVTAERRAHCARLLLDLLAEADEREMTMPVPAHPVGRTVAEALLADPGDDTELHEWARRHAVSARTIARAFVSETGHSFTAWRTKVRLLAALPLLVDGTPVHRAGAQVGFGSTGGFIAAFTREFGSTPAAYVRGRR